MLDQISKIQKKYIKNTILKNSILLASSAFVVLYGLEVSAADFNLDNTVKAVIKPIAKVLNDYYLPATGIGSVAGGLGTLFMGGAGQDTRGVMIKAGVGAAVGALITAGVMSMLGVTELAMQ